MTILNLKDFMKKYKLKNNTKNESRIQKGYKYPIYPGDSKTYSDKGIVNIDNGQMDGRYSLDLFDSKKNKSYNFDSFGGQPDTFLPNQLPKPIIYHNFEIQDISSKFCDSYCLYFFYLIDRMNYYDTILKRYFENCKPIFLKFYFRYKTFIERLLKRTLT